MSGFNRLEDIDTWKKARGLVKAIYNMTIQSQKFSLDFGLRDQIRRAAVSVVSNIAEGYEREGNKEFYQFLSLAKGSIGEIKAQLYVALDVNYIAENEFKSLYEQTDEVGRMIKGLMSYLKKSSLKGKKYVKVPSS